MNECSPITDAERMDMCGWHQPISGPFEVMITIDRFRELRSMADRAQCAEKDRDRWKAAHDADYAKQQTTINELLEQVTQARKESQARWTTLVDAQKRVTELEASLTELQNFTGYRKNDDGTWDAFDSGGEMQYSLAIEKENVRGLKAHNQQLEQGQSAFLSKIKELEAELAKRGPPQWGIGPMPGSVEYQKPADERPSVHDVMEAMQEDGRRLRADGTVDFNGFIAALLRCGMVRP